jgi:prepilin-type N-terminal cleavage/methylation domain-containing protein
VSNYEFRNLTHFRQRENGFSLIELTLVLALIGILTALALPQLVGQRRLWRSAAIVREITTQLRFARQQAMTQRQSFTFQYNNTTKQIRIIDHNASGPAVLTASNYPNNPGSVVVVTNPLTQGGLASSEITYGIPSGLPTAALADGVSRTNLTSGVINITFQPNGSVVDAAGNPLDRALFIYNNKVPSATAAAVSVIGSAGRVKQWRYDSVRNAYVE